MDEEGEGGGEAGGAEAAVAGGQGRPGWGLRCAVLWLVRQLGPGAGCLVSGGDTAGGGRGDVRGRLSSRIADSR